MNTDTALVYLDFVVERHRVWEKRQQGAPQPWTDDPILRTRKFTNVYRVLDYGSQFLVSELLTPDLSPRDALARCFLYRYTNLPATWTVIREALGHYPVELDLDVHLCDAIIQHRDTGAKVFSGAYVILPQPNREGDKVVQAVRLAYDWMTNHADDFLAATTQAQRYEILRREYGVGPFLAMQILTDWGYSPQAAADRENDFVVAGPGAIKGAGYIWPGKPAHDVIQWAWETVMSLPDCPLLPLDDYGGEYRPPSLMDIQNTLCEFSKYHRFADKPLPAKEYVPAHPGAQPAPVLPSAW